MHFKKLHLLSMLGLGLTLLSCDNDKDMMEEPIPPVAMPNVAPAIEFSALTNNNQVVYYNARNLSSPIRTISISGLANSEQIISIDYRPATGQLYGLSNTSRLYLINEMSGLATALGSSSFTPALSGSTSSIDFNPTVDRIRLVGNGSQNLRLHPELGTVVATDGNINGITNPMIGAIAYTNSFAGATSTQLFTIDATTDKLYLQNPPNDGGQQEIGSLEVDFTDISGFDILSPSNYGMAVNRKDNESRLYQINLSTGKATWIGIFPTNTNIIEIAFKTEPIAYAVSDDQKLYRINLNNGATNMSSISGLNTNEMIVGIDFRPANGSLFAITNQSRLLTINTSNGQTAVVGSTLNPMIQGTNFGFDFNPVVDRIRLISNTRQNLRLHPDLGTVVATDGMLSPGTPVGTATAYSNNFPQTTSTTMYVIDSNTNQLFIQNPPNDGILTLVGGLGFDIENNNGFDIGGFSNNAYGIFKVNGQNAVYRVQLSNGAATKMFNINFEVTAMSVGLGF